MNQLKISTIITIIVLFCLGSAPISAGEQLKKHDPSLAISVDSAIRQHRKNRIFLVDVRRPKEFARLNIPGSVNIPIFAIKSKSFLKSSLIVLVNEGYGYRNLEQEGRRLTKRGFKVSILDGGLPAWKRKGGQLTGDIFALEDMKNISPQVFFKEKDYGNTLIVDISPTRSEASNRLIPYAKHLPVLDGNDGSVPEFKKLISKNKPFQSIIFFNETGERYEKAYKIMSRMGIEAFNLQGGVAGYQKYLEGLLLSWKPRDSRLKTVSNCKPCGEKAEAEISQTGK